MHGNHLIIEGTKPKIYGKRKLKKPQLDAQTNLFKRVLKKFERRKTQNTPTPVTNQIIHTKNKSIEGSKNYYTKRRKLEVHNQNTTSDNTNTEIGTIIWIRDCPKAGISSQVIENGTHNI